MNEANWASELLGLPKASSRAYFAPDRPQAVMSIAKICLQVYFKSRMQHLSRILTICFLVFCFQGCSTKPKQSGFAAASSQRSALLKEYSQLRDPRIDRYLSYLLERISTGIKLIPKISNATSLPSVSVLDTNQIIACSLGANMFALSTGMILSLSSEAELAFVVAHELSHEFLGHHMESRASYATLGQESSELELAADSLALGIIANAGYDPRTSAVALVNAFRGAARTSNQDLESVLAARLNNVNKLTLESGWLPPGTVNRRDFIQLQALLREMAQ